MPTVAEVLEMMRGERYAVQASVSSRDGAPQAAIVGIVVSDRLEILFDTLEASRKASNLRRRGAAALVFGPFGERSERTIQLEGPADEPDGPDLERLLRLYLAKFPDGEARRSSPGLTYFRIRPTWIRYSNFGVDPPEIVEFTGDALLLVR